MGSYGRPGYTRNHKTMNDVDIDELRQARFIGLMCPPASPQARALVDHVIHVIAQTEKRRRARKTDDLSAFKTAVGLIVGDLLIAIMSKEPRWSYHPMSTATFGDRPVGYKIFKQIMGAMEIAGLVEVAKGRNSRGIVFDEGAAPIYSPGLATRFRPTEVFMLMAEKAGINEGGPRKHFIHQLPKHVIEVRGKSTNTGRIKIKGSKIRTPHNEKSRAMEADLLELNKFLASFDLEGASFSGYRRLFSNGDVEGFDFQWGGRIYGVGDHNYQLLKKEDRRKLKINGDEVIEIDINASYLTILHGINGYPLPEREDIYAIADLPREIVKAWITATIGHHTFHTRWPKAALDELKDKGVVKPKTMAMKALEPVIVEHFPMLSDWSSSHVRWADLMFIESEIVIGTMLELMWSYGIPCYSVHDSIIVRKSDTELALDLLSQQFSSKTGIRPKLKVK